MKERVEILTASKSGLAAFLLDLKREQIRSQMPFDRFVAELSRKIGKSRNKKEKEFLKSKDRQEVVYARFVDGQVAAWEARQRAAVEEMREAQAPEEIAALGPALVAELADIRATELEGRFHSIHTYLGDLNRDINAGRVAAYRTEMEEGRWWFTPDPIVVTDAGYIINGQHRLLAVERALEEGKEFDPPRFVVVWGVDKRAAILMDEARRTATDRRDIAMRYARSNAQGARSAPAGGTR